MVDFHSWLSADRVKPKSDIRSRSFDERSGEGVGYVLLNDFGEIVNFTKQNDPAVICIIVMANFFRGIEPLLG